MALRPTGFRILVKPDAQKTETDSGLVLLKDRHHIPVSGTVVAIGNGSEREHQERVRVLKEALTIVEKLAVTFQHPAPLQMAYQDIDRYLAKQKVEEPDIKLWDRVVFPTTAGQQVTEDGEDYVLLNEDDVLAVVSEDEAVEVA